MQADFIKGWKRKLADPFWEEGEDLQSSRDPPIVKYNIKSTGNPRGNRIFPGISSGAGRTRALAADDNVGEKHAGIEVLGVWLNIICSIT
jgi:hypothetical protein